MTNPDKNLQELDAKSEAMLSELLDAAPIAMFGATEKGDIKIVNLAAMALFGYKKSEFVNMNVREIIAFEDIGADSKAISATGDTFPIHFQKKITQLDGASILICSILDTSKESQLKKEIQEVSLELQKSREEIGTFISIASHDLKSPLRRSKSFIDLVHKNYQPLLDEQGQDWLKRCSSNLDHMQSLISDLSMFSVIESKTEASCLCNLQDIAVKEFNQLKESKHPNAKINFDSELPQIKGDPLLLAILFNNLFENSLAYNNSEIPAVDIQCSLAAEKWELSIADNGLGIEEKFRDSIFDFFKRLHSGQRYPGNGLGLAISQRIAKHHGGSLTLSAEQPRQGATFFLILPVA